MLSAIEHNEQDTLSGCLQAPLVGSVESRSAPAIFLTEIQTQSLNQQKD